MDASTVSDSGCNFDEIYTERKLYKLKIDRKFTLLVPTITSLKSKARQKENKWRISTQTQCNIYSFDIRNVDTTMELKVSTSVWMDGLALAQRLTNDLKRFEGQFSHRIRIEIERE